MTIFMQMSFTNLGSDNREATPAFVWVIPDPDVLPAPETKNPTRPSNAVRVAVFV